MPSLISGRETRSPYRNVTARYETLGLSVWIRSTVWHLNGLCNVGR